MRPPQNGRSAAGGCVPSGADLSNASIESTDLRESASRTRPRSFGPPILITGPDELRAFAASRAFASNQPVIIRLNGRSLAADASASERINKDRAACGCALGAQAMAAAFLITLALLMSLYGPFTLATLARTPIALAAALVFAGLGKAVGMAKARNRARREIANIVSTLTCVS
jgi:hypothetical protein